MRARRGYASICRVWAKDLTLYNVIKVKANFDIAEKEMDQLGKSLPFAIARTLTAVAQDGQEAGREQVGKVFKERNDWTRRNIRITPATKNSQVAEVYTDTSNKSTGAPDYLPPQEDGGEKVPVNGRQHLAIPTKYLRRIVGDDKPIPDYLRPNAMLAYAANKGSWENRRGKMVRGTAATRGVYFFKVQFKSGAFGIMMRNAHDARDAALPMYVFVRSAHIRERLHLEETVKLAIDEKLARRWEESFAKTVVENGLRGEAIQVRF